MTFARKRRADMDAEIKKSVAQQVGIKKGKMPKGTTDKEAIQALIKDAERGIDQAKKEADSLIHKEHTRIGQFKDYAKDTGVSLA
jgi:hypothetical protein